MDMSGTCKLQVRSKSQHPLQTYLVVDDHIVLGSHVVGNVVVHNQPEEAVEQRQVNLLVHFFKE